MKVGDILAEKYRLVSEIGRGGEGSVFLALHLQTDMFWAVKVISNGAMSADRCHELQMMKSLHNRHLPRIIDVLEEKTAICLVMEHVRGSCLRESLKNGQTATPEQTEDAAFQVCDALCYLESRSPQVFHLDIKPSNLIRTPDGLIKLVDFGSAWKEQEISKRQGTDGYAAPEQYEKGAALDIRTDIYGLGATLYRMITGKTYSKILRKSRIPNCPEALGNILSRCLSQAPEDRFQSASELKSALISMKRKRRFRTMRLRMLGSMAIALPATAFCVSALPESMDLAAERNRNYDSILREAKVARAEDRDTLYRRAIFLEPGRSNAYLQYLTDALRDGVYSEEEERFLRNMLHTIEPGSDRTNEELLEETPEEYGPVAVRLGQAYLKRGQEEDQRIAKEWFARAADAAEKAARYGEEEEICEEQNWVREARAYERMSEGEASEEKSIPELLRERGITLELLLEEET